MAENSRSGKLAVILHADIAGSTMLVQQDERLAHERIQDTFRRFSGTIGKYQGHVRELRGDALLAEFERASDAVTAVLAFQAEQAENIAQLSDNIRPAVRVGISLGEVIIADNTVTGAGVVLAQRIEQLAEPGGLCITGAIHEALPQRLPFEQENLGERQVKGFNERIKVYAVSLSPGASIPGPEPLPQTEAVPLALPDKPSIAVLPFTNMSGDQEQEYFSDGITEDIITELSRFRSLSVIARNSSFVFKGLSVDIKEIAGKLGVQYLVEGSVRKAGERVRITAQLLDAKSGAHLWADRYDRKLEDIFAVQDEVVRVISGRIPGMLEQVSVEFARRKVLGSATAIDLLFKGRWALHHTNEGTLSAIDLLEKSVVLDENLASAHAWLAYAYSFAIFTAGFDPEEASRLACEHADRAVVLDRNDPQVNATAAIAYLLSGEHDLADAHSERASNANPNDAHVAYSRGLVLSYLGRPHEGLQFFKYLEQIDPYAPDDVRNDGFCDCLFLLGEYEKMLEIYSRWPNLPQHLILVRSLALSMLGRLDEARASVSEYNALETDKLEPSDFVKYQVRMAARPEDREKWMDGYRKAGVLV